MNLKQLSHILGLSQTTVSRALNGYPEVGAATRERVQKAAREHGYHPNSRAKSLATGRAMAVGHVIPLSSGHEMVNPIFSDFIAGAGEVYSRNGYDMLLSVVEDAMEEATYRNLHSRRAVDGIILHGPRMQDSRIELLRDIGLPFVVHGRASDLAQDLYSWVDVNNFRAFTRATEFLLDLGHRRIGLINGLETMDFAHRRRRGYETALRERGVQPVPDLMHSSEMTEIQGHAAARAMLELADPPTAFLVSAMIPAVGVRRALDDAGLQMGRDVSVITHDDDLSYLRNGQDVPIFTALRSSVREAGRRSAQMLLDRIASGRGQQDNELMEAELVVGQSSGPLNRDQAQ